MLHFTQKTLLITIASCFFAQTLLQNKSTAAENYALLVGCTQYSAGGYRELVGAANDVQGFQNLLTKSLDFDEVVTLSGWPEDLLKRPTYKNITREYERLIERAQPESQIVILMAGHGFRFPLPDTQTDVLDPDNPEPDGLDEAFLAADYQAGKNMILDNQIGDWLERLRAKGAHTLIIFDSCFSGTMTRGERGEVSREITASEAGVSLKKLKLSQNRARVQLAKLEQKYSRNPEGIDLQQSGSHTGSVVAFYAAQEFETAPEVTRPIGADTTDSRFKHGLLSYHLEQELRNLSSSVSYRDLGRSLVRRYRADGRRYPTPFWEGDLDREVLGFKEWPEAAAAIRLLKEDNELHVSGGLLAGITKDSILAVFAPDDLTYKSPTGYVRVIESGVQFAKVAPITYEGQQAIEPQTLPSESICRIIYQDLGVAKISLWLDPILTSNQQLKFDQKQNVFQIVKNEEDADWVLIAEADVLMSIPQSDSSEFQAGAVLLPAVHVTVLDQRGAQLTKQLAKVPHTIIYKSTLLNSELLTTQVTTELQKVIVWRNLWKVAKAYESPSLLVPKQDINLVVDVNSNLTGKIKPISRLNNSDRISLSIENLSYNAYWYCLVILDGRYGVSIMPVKGIPGRNLRNSSEKQVTRRIGTITVNHNSIGTNGFLLLAVSQKQSREQPNYRFLAQAQIGKQSAIQRNVASEMKTPFEKLLWESFAGGDMAFRGPKTLENPQISSWSWVTFPSPGME